MKKVFLTSGPGFGCLKLTTSFFNPIAHGKAKIVYSFGLSECSRVNK